MTFDLTLWLSNSVIVLAVHRAGDDSDTNDKETDKPSLSEIPTETKSEQTALSSEQEENLEVPNVIETEDEEKVTPVPLNDQSTVEQVGSVVMTSDQVLSENPSKHPCACPPNEESSQSDVKEDSEIKALSTDINEDDSEYLNTISERTEKSDDSVLSKDAMTEVPPKKLIIQRMPQIDIRPPLTVQKIFEIEIKPAGGTSPSVLRTSNIGYEEVTHPSANEKDAPVVSAGDDSKTEIEHKLEEALKGICLCEVQKISDVPPPIKVSLEEHAESKQAEGLRRYCRCSNRGGREEPAEPVEKAQEAYLRDEPEQEPSGENASEDSERKDVRESTAAEEDETFVTDLNEAEKYIQESAGHIAWNSEVSEINKSPAGSMLNDLVEPDEASVGSSMGSQEPIEEEEPEEPMELNQLPIPKCECKEEHKAAESESECGSACVDNENEKTSEEEFIDTGEPDVTYINEAYEGQTESEKQLQIEDDDKSAPVTLLTVTPVGADSETKDPEEEKEEEEDATKFVTVPTECVCPRDKGNQDISITYGKDDQLAAQSANPTEINPEEPKGYIESEYVLTHDVSTQSSSIKVTEESAKPKETPANEECTLKSCVHFRPKTKCSSKSKIKHKRKRSQPGSHPIANRNVASQEAAELNHKEPSLLKVQESHTNRKDKSDKMKKSVSKIGFPSRGFDVVNPAPKEGSEKSESRKPDSDTPVSGSSDRGIMLKSDSESERLSTFSVRTPVHDDGHVNKPVDVNAETVMPVMIQYERTSVRRCFERYIYPKLHKTKDCKDIDTTTSSSESYGPSKASRDEYHRNSRDSPFSYRPYGDKFSSFDYLQVHPNGRYVDEADDFCVLPGYEPSTSSSSRIRSHSKSQKPKVPVSSTSDSTATRLEETLSEGEIRCKCSASIGELHICNYAQEIKARAGAFKHSRDNIRIMKQKGCYRWSTSYIPSSEVDSTDPTSDTKDPGEAREAPEPCTKPTRPCLKYTKNKSVEYDFLEQHKENIQKVDQLIEEAKNSIQALKREFYQVSQDHMKKIAEGREDDSCLCLASDNPNEKQKAVPHLYSVVKKRDQMPKFYYKSASVADSTSYTSLDPCVCSSDELKSTFDEDVTDESPKRTDADAIDDTDTDNAEVMPEAVSDALEVIIENSTEDVPRNSEQQEEKITDRTQPQTKNLAGMCQECNEDKPENAKRIFANIRYEIIVYSGTDRDLRERSNALVSKFVKEKVEPVLIDETLNLVRQCHLKEQAEPCHLEEQIPKRSTRTESTPTSTDANVIPVVSGDTESLPTVQEQTEETKQPPDKTPLRVCDCEEGLNTVDKEQEHAQKGTDVTAKINEELAALCNCSDEESEEKQRSTEVKIKRSSVHFSKESMHKGTSPDLLENGKELRHSSTSTDQDQKSAPTIKASGDDLKEERKDVKQSTSLASTLSRKLSCLPSLSAIRSKSKVSISGSQIAPKRSVSTRSTPPNRGAIKTLSKGKEIEAKSASVLNMEVAPDAEQATAETNVIRDVSGNAEILANSREQAEEEKPSEQASLSGKKPIRVCDCEEGPKSVDRELAALCDCSDEEDEEKQTQNSDLLDEEEELPHSSASTDADQRSVPTQNTSGDDPEEKKTKVIKESKDKLIDAQQTTSETNVIPDVSGNTESIHSGQEQTEENKPSEQIFPSRKQTFRICDCEQGPKPVDKELAALCECSDEEDEEKQASEEENPEQTIPSGEKRLRICDCEEGPIEPIDKELTALCDCTDEEDEEKPTSNEPRIGTSSVRHSKAHAIPDVPGDTESMPSAPPDYEEISPSGSKIQQNTKSTSRTKSTPASRGTSRILSKGRKIEGSESTINDEHTTNETNVTPDVPADTQSLPSAPPAYDEISTSDSKIEQKPKSKYATRILSKIKGKSASVVNTEATPDAEQATGETNVAPRALKDTKNLPSAPPEYEKVSISDSNIERKRKSSSRSRSTPISRDASKALPKDKKIEAKSGRVLNRKATPDAGQTTDETNVIPNVLNVLSDVPKQTDKKQTSSAPRIARRKEGMPKSSIPSERKTSKSSVVSHKPLSDVNLSQKGDTSSVRSVSASSSEGESEDVDKVDKEIQEDVEVDEKNISVTEKDFVVDENPQLNSISEERTPSSENDQTENLHEAGRSYVSTRYASGQSNAAPAQVQSLSSPSRNDTKMPKSPSTPRRKPRYSTRSPTVMPVLVQYDRDDVEKRLQSVIYPDGKLSIKGPSELKKKPHHKKSPKSKTRSLEGKYESAESQTTRRVRNARSGTGDSRKSKKSSSNTATQTVKAESGHQKIQASLDPAASLKSIQDSRSNFSAYNDRGFTVKPLVKLSVLVDNTVPDISNLGLAKASHLISAKKSRSRQDAPNTTTTDGRNTTLSSVQVSISPPKTPHRKSRISGSGKSGSSVATRLSNDSLPGYLSDISTTRIHDDSVPNEDMPRLCLKIGATIRPRSQQSTQSSQVKLDSVKVSVDKRPSSSPFHSAVRLTSPSPDLDAPPKEKVGNRSPISPHLKAKLKEDSLKSGSYQTKQTAHQQTSKRSLSPDDIAKTPMPMSKIYYAMYTTESGSSNYYRFRPSNRFLYEAPGGCISPNREVSRSHGERPQVVLAADDQMVRLASSARHLARGSSQFSIDDDMDYNLPTKRKTSPPGEERDRESNESNVNISVSLKLLPKVQRYDNEEYNVTSRPSKSEAHVGKLEIDILPPHSNETSEVSGNPVADISVSSQRSDINAHSKSRISLANYKIVYQVFGSRSSSSSQFMRMPSPDNPNNVKEAHADKENQLSDAIAKPNEKENLHSINEAESESRTTESESVLISETSQQQRLKTEVQNEPQPQKKEDDSSRASFSCQLPAEFLDSTYTLKYVHGLNAQERETFSHCDYADEETEADKSTSLSGSEEPTFEPKTSTLSSSQQMNTEENNCSPTTQEAETPSKKLSGDVADPAPAQTITAVEAIRSDNRQIGNDSLQGRAPVFTSLEFFPASDQTGLLVTEDTRISNLKQPELNQVTWSKIVLRDDFDGEARVAATDLKSSTLSDQNMGANAENLDENTETHASMPQGKEFQRMYILTSHTQENLLKPPILSQETCAVGIITDNLNEVIGEAKDPENGISETRQGTEELEDTSETTLDELADLENAKKKAETYVPVGTSRTHTEIVTTKSEKIQLEPWLQEMGAENFSQTVTTFDVVKDGCAIYSDSRPMYAEAVFDPLEAMVGERMIGERHMKMLPLNKDVRKDTRAPVKERESRIDDAEPKKGLNNEISFKPLLDLSLTSSELSLLKCIESLHPQKVTSGDFNKREKTEECLPAPGSKSPKLKFGGAAEASAGLVVREFNEMVNAECVKTLAAKTEVTQSRVQEEKIQGSMPRSGQRKRLKGETAENFSQTLIEKDDKSVLKTYLDSDAPLPKAFVTSNTQGNVQQLTVEEGRGPSGTEDFQAGKSLKPYDTSTQTRTPILFPTEDKTLELCTYSDNLQSVQNFANDYLAYDPSTVLQDLNVQTSPGFDSSRRVDVSFAKIPETTEALDPDSSQATNLPQGIPTGASITITEQHSGTSTTVSEKSEFTNTYQTQTRTTITANSEHKILHNFTDYDTATSTSKPYIRGKRIQKTSKQIRSYSSNFHPTEETWTQVAGSEPRFAENVPLSMHQPSDPSIEENVKVSKLHSKGCCTPKAKRQKVSRTISASELHRNPAKPEDLHLKHLLVHPNGRYKDEAESFCEPAHAATPSTTDTSEQYQWKYLLNELEKVSPPVDVQSRHHTELKQAVHPGSSSKRKIEVKETIPKQSLKPHKRQRHLNRETLVSSSETPTENQVVSDFIVGLPTGKCRRSISSRYRHDSASIPSTSDFSKSTNLYGLLSEGEVKCGDSCISVGEVRLYPQMPRVTTKSNYLKRHPEKMLSYELAEDNIRITRRKAKYENWVTYYTSRDSSPSGSSSDT